MGHPLWAPLYIDTSSVCIINFHLCTSLSHYLMCIPHIIALAHREGYPSKLSTTVLLIALKATFCSDALSVPVEQVPMLYVVCHVCHALHVGSFSVRALPTLPQHHSPWQQRQQLNDSYHSHITTYPSLHACSSSSLCNLLLPRHTSCVVDRIITTRLIRIHTMAMTRYLGIMTALVIYYFT